MEDALKTKLTGDDVGMTEEQVAKLETDGGVQTEADLAMLSDAEVKEYSGCTPVVAKKAVATVKPAEASADPTAELEEGSAPSSAHVNGFAQQLGMDPMMAMLFFNGQMGDDMDLSSMMPISTVVEGYNPKIRNMFLMAMGHFEKRFGVPIVVIDSDGGINKSLTADYIQALEEGFDPVEGTIYLDDAGKPYELIQVGVDAQSVYDADPLNPTKALPKNNIGVGRVKWKDVPLEVRQVAFYAVTQTNEIDPANDGHVSWLRENVNKSANRLIFHGQAPEAIAAYNEAARTGSLPTLRVMLSRGPRRKETMPRRRRRPAGIGADVSMTARSFGGDE